MCELTKEMLEADSKPLPPIAPKTPWECIRAIETQLGMIEAMLIDTRALVAKFKQEYPECQSST